TQRFGGGTADINTANVATAQLEIDPAAKNQPVNNAVVPLVADRTFQFVTSLLTSLVESAPPPLQPLVGGVVAIPTPATLSFALSAGYSVALALGALGLPLPPLYEASIPTPKADVTTAPTASTNSLAGPPTTSRQPATDTGQATSGEEKASDTDHATSD